jgi:hypothetical protein
MIYRCPDYQHPTDTADSVGCGHEFESEPDHEGIVDCPNCGMWFTPTKEPTPLEQLAELGNLHEKLEGTASSLQSFIEARAEEPKE